MNTQQRCGTAREASTGDHPESGIGDLKQGAQPGAIPFCVNCRFYYADWGVWCEHPSNGIDVVTGRSNIIIPCVMRAADGRCGPSGKLFEPLPPPPDSRFIEWVAAHVRTIATAFGLPPHLVKR